MIQFEELDKAHIVRIKPLWEKLNMIHLEESIYFKEHYAEFTFEKRVESILKKDDQDIKTTLVVDDHLDKGYCFSTADGQNGEVESLYIDEDLRGSGVGRELVEMHVTWLKEKGCKRIRLGVSYGNDKVMGFYHKLGFYERLTYLEYKEEKADI